MYKLDLEKVEPEIKLPTSVGSQKKQENLKKSTSAPLTIRKSLCRLQQTVENSSRDRNIRPPHQPPEKSVAGQEAIVKTRHRTTDWFQIGKGVHRGCILSLCLFNLYAEYIMRNTGLDESRAGIKIAWRNINSLR